MCLHYLVKLTARVLSPHITYFFIQVVDFWPQIFTNCWNNSFQQSTTVSVVVQQCCCNCALWLCRLIVWLLITLAVTVFSVLWLFQSLSHAAVVKCYDAFCVELTANSDTEQNNISNSTFPVCVCEHFHI